MPGPKGSRFIAAAHLALSNRVFTRNLSMRHFCRHFLGQNIVQWTEFAKMSWAAGARRVHGRTYENGHHAGGVDRWQLAVQQAPPQVPDLVACKCQDKPVSENARSPRRPKVLCHYTVECARSISCAQDTGTTPHVYQCGHTQQRSRYGRDGAGITDRQRAHKQKGRRNSACLRLRRPRCGT